MIQFRKIFFAIAVVFISISIADAMRCVFKQPSENGILGAVKDRLESCPPLFIDSEKEYCCLDTEFKSYCCDLPHFLVNISLWLIPVLIVLLIISSLVSCICCLCCPCCFVYKRRHGI